MPGQTVPSWESPTAVVANVGTFVLQQMILQIFLRQQTFLTNVALMYFIVFTVFVISMMIQRAPVRIRYTAIVAYLRPGLVVVQMHLIIDLNFKFLLTPIAMVFIIVGVFTYEMLLQVQVIFRVEIALVAFVNRHEFLVIRSQMFFQAVFIFITPRAIIAIVRSSSLPETNNTN